MTISLDDIRDNLEGYGIDTTSTISITGNTVLTSPIITNVSSITGLKPYMKISGTGIPLNSRIVSIDTSSQITIDNNATANGTTVALTVTYYTQISDGWIYNRIYKMVVPLVENYTRMKFSGVQSVSEYYSGNGKNVLMLNRRPIVDVSEIRYVIGGYSMPILNLAMIEQVKSEGILKAKSNFDEAYFLPVFAKGLQNIKVTYTYGYADYPDDIKESVIYLTCSHILNFIGARTGGGSLSVQGFSRNFGARGKYTDVIQEFDRKAYGLMSKYKNMVVGN